MGLIITPAQFRDFYPGLKGTGEDTYLTTMIDYVDAALAVWCGNPPTNSLTYTWTSAAYDLRYDGPLESEPRIIDLQTMVLSTASAAISAAYSDSTWTFGTALPSTDWLLDKSRGRVILTPSSTSSWSASVLSNRFVATGGFGTTPPEVIEAAAHALKALLEGGPKPEGFTALSAGGRSVTRAEAARLLPRRSMDLMTPWRGSLGG